MNPTQEAKNRTILERVREKCQPNYKKIILNYDLKYGYTNIW